jgi:DUF971 family protein
MPHPTRIHLHRRSRVLEVTFDDGTVFLLQAPYLRVFSPSAEVSGHGGPALRPAGKENVAITAVEPVGHYAVRLVFDDGHNSGLYSWPLLHELGQNKARNWQEYLDSLKRAKGQA